MDEGLNLIVSRLLPSSSSVTPRPPATCLHPGSAAASTQDPHEGAAHVPGSSWPRSVLQLICSRD